MQIDLTELATYLEQDAGKLTAEIVCQFVRSQPWGGIFNIKLFYDLLRILLTKAFDIGFRSAVMQAFFLVTAERKAVQASDYVAACAALKLPAINLEAAKKLEQAKIEAFKNLVMVTR